MREVKIFTATNISGIKASAGSFGYVLETQGKRGTVTREGFEKFESATKNQAELRAISAALGRMTEPCVITIYTESSYVASGMEWVEAWKENNWITTRNKPVANKDEWILMLERMKDHIIRIERREHEYSGWLHSEMSRSCTGATGKGD